MCFVSVERSLGFGVDQHNLEIPVEDNKEDVKSEAKSPKVKKLSEVEEPSITTVSKEELSQRSNEAQRNRSAAS
jgi:translation elongation factor EF-1beta